MTRNEPLTQLQYVLIGLCGLILILFPFYPAFAALVCESLGLYVVVRMVGQIVGLLLRH